MESFIATFLIPGSDLPPDTHSKKFSLEMCDIQPSALLLTLGSTPPWEYVVPTTTCYGITAPILSIPPLLFLDCPLPLTF